MLLLIVIVVSMAGITVFTRPDAAFTLQGAEVSPPQKAAELLLDDQFGQPFRVADHRGKVLLMYFGYTTCPDLCPTTLSDFITIKQELGAASEGVEYIFVTVDPDRDSPERIQQYLGFFDPTFIGLSGDDETTDLAKTGYGVFSQRVEQPDSATGYLVDHTSLIYVVDRDGNLRVTYPYGTDPVLIAGDVRHLIQPAS